MIDTITQEIANRRGAILKSHTALGYDGGRINDLGVYVAEHWPALALLLVPQPIETAPKDRKILAFFGPEYADWYRCRWEDDKYAKTPKPLFEPSEARYLGRLWARANQPKLWLPLPPAPETT